MKLSKLVSPESIFIGWPEEPRPKIPDKWALIDCLTKATCRVFQCDQEVTAAALSGITDREKSMTTGIGMGIAIPHASLTNLPRPIGSICLLKEGLEFNSIDNKPAHIIILILVPKNEFQHHIRTLASIARLMNDNRFRESLSAAKTGQEAYELICAHEADD